MSELDPPSMKVAELREELKTRGLETKGNKAQLVKRLQKVLNEDAGGTDADDTMDSELADSTLDDSSRDVAEVETPEVDAEPPTVVSPTKAAPDPSPTTLSPETTPAKTTPEVTPTKTTPEKPKTSPRVSARKAAAAAVVEEKMEVTEEVKDETVTPTTETTEVEKEETTANEEKVEKNDVEEGEGDIDFGNEEFEVMDQIGDDDDEKKDDEKRSHKRRHSRSRSRSRERQRPRYRSRTPPPVVQESDDWLEITDVVIDRYNCDLNMRVDDNNLKANPVTADGFAFMWCGLRANYGVSKGKVAFEVKILEHLNVDHLPAEETTKHVVRVGFSTNSTSMQLGEEKLSYGYGGTGKASTECQFKDYGETFREGDVVTGYVDFENNPIQISFAKNGEDLGVCFEIDPATLDEQALFPHVLTKNTEFELNFGSKEEPYFPLKEGFVFIQSVPLEDRVRGSLPPSKKEECEMIMMCGLPGCGKTTWATKYAQENPEKQYNVLGTNNIIDKMKVMGLPRKKNYAGRWDVLIDKSTKCLNRLFEIAAKKKRNYILDQTNVYASAQRRKMRPFEGFQRKAVVIVPTDEEYKNRCSQREKEEGKDVPDSAVLEMKANFTLPVEGQQFDSVEFVELDKEESTKLVEQYNKEGKAAAPPRRFQGDRDRRDNRYGSRGGRDFRSRGGYDRDYRGRGGYRDDRRGGYQDRNRRGGYMGYSDRDRQKMTVTGQGRYDKRQQYDRRRGGSGSYGGSGWGNQGSWGNQGGWGSNQGNWNNQAGWGNQGWGGGQWNQQGWGGYGQQGNQNWGQGYNYWNQGSWPSYGSQGYGSYGSSGYQR